MRLQTAFLLTLSLAAIAAEAAEVSQRNGKAVSGDIQGIVVQKDFSAAGVEYRLLPGATVVSIDAQGVHVLQAKRTELEDNSPPSLIKVLVPSQTPDAQLSPSVELQLLRSAASTDFAQQMKGLISFRVTTGLGVDRAEDYQTTVSSHPIYAVLMPEGDLVQSLTIKTLTGPQAISLTEIVPPMGKPAGN